MNKKRLSLLLVFVLLLMCMPVTAVAAEGGETITDAHIGITTASDHSSPRWCYEYNKDVPMPTRQLDNNTVVVFSWRDQQSDNCYGASKPDMRKVYKDVGLQTEWYQATHASYRDALAAVVASGNSPDLVEWNTSQMYPAAIASGLVQPLDAYVDWNAPIWNDVRSLTDKYRIKGNAYFSFEYMQVEELLYYDPTIIKSKGLKTPLELWKAGKWTLKELQKIADETVQINRKGEVTRYGFVPGDIGTITGLELVEYDDQTGYKLNITNSKYKTLMNVMEQMGVNGTRSAGFTTPGDVGTGNVVMAMTAGWSMINEMNAARENGRLEWCVLPKLDDNSQHYYPLTRQLTFGLISGAKNPEGAAYLIELRKWAFLNYPWLETLPFTDTAYTRQYGEKTALAGQGTLTDEEIAYTAELLSCDYDTVTANLWSGWIGNGQFPGLIEVIYNGNRWSTVLANKKPTLEAILKKWDFSGVQQGPANAFEYTVEDGQVTLTKYIGTDTVVTIPFAIDGLPVTAIGDAAFEDCVNLASVTIPDSVTAIGRYAFCNCASLTTAIIPDSVTDMGEGAFDGCYALTIHTKPNTCAQAYAVNNRIPYVLLLNPGWQPLNDKWYYGDADGYMVTEKWMQDSMGWVYLGADGAMMTNAWVRDSKGWCYVGADGYCITNKWMKDSVGWVYLDAIGRMVTQRWVEDSVGWCYVGADGYCVTNKWLKDSKGWVYLDGSGRMVTNKWVQDSKGWCFVGSDGYAVANCWKRDSVGWCYLDGNGSMVKNNWVKDGGKWYYLDGNGYMLSNTSRKIGSKTYKFNASGVCINP